MISYNGWDRDYLQNRNDYITVFDQCMVKEHEGNVESLEKNMAIFSGRRHAIAVSSATDALYFSLVANNIGPGDEVLVTSFSWISSASVVSIVGATPVFCDIDYDTYHMNFESIERMTSNKTKAIIYPHLFGYMCDTSKIEQYCKEKNILFIEDSAQSLGSSLDGKKAGKIGDCSNYSFNSNKVIAGISGGGVFLTDDDEIAQKVIRLRRHGKGKDDFEMLGINSKMFVPNAEIINLRLRKMGLWQQKRQEIARKYDKSFKDFPLYIQKNARGLQHNYHKYVVRFEDKETREFAKQSLKRNGINPQVHYDKVLSKNTLYQSHAYLSDDTPNAEMLQNQIMSLPIHPFLQEDEINKVIKSISDIF